MSREYLETEQREHPRRPYFEAVILLAGDHAWLVRAVNASRGGIALERPPDCTLEPEAVIRLIFPARPGPVPVVSARIAWIDAGEIGCEYHEPQVLPPRRGGPPR